MGISNELRGRIYAKYPNMAAMADSMGWSRQRLYKTLKYPDSMPLKNYHAILKALDLVCDNDAIRFFMPKTTI